VSEVADLLVGERFSEGQSAELLRGAEEKWVEGCGGEGGVPGREPRVSSRSTL